MLNRRRSMALVRHRADMALHSIKGVQPCAEVEPRQRRHAVRFRWRFRSRVIAYVEAPNEAPAPPSAALPGVSGNATSFAVGGRDVGNRLTRWVSNKAT